MINHFKDHLLTEVIRTDKIKIYDFRNKNGSSNCYQRWIIDHGTLIVTGDNYCSIYNWNNSSITLDFLANCNLGYFSSKCLADKDGHSQMIYSQEHATEYMQILACDTFYNSQLADDKIELSSDQWTALSHDEQFKITTSVLCEHLDLDQDEFESIFINETIEEAARVLHDSENECMFGSDGWEHVSSLNVLTMTPKMHLAALKEANKAYPNQF
jgi:hypothetical protein